jgi:hypothetical protein
VPTSRQVIAGTGLTGGGTLAADVTISMPVLISSGSFTNPNVTVDAEGRITAITSGSAGGPASSVSFDPTGTDYTSTNVQAALVEVDGWRSVDIASAVTQARSGMVANTRQVIAGTGLSGGGALSADVTISMPAVVTAGSATYASVTVDAEGRVTAFSSGATPVPTSRQVKVAGILTGGGALTGDVTITNPGADSYFKPTGSIRETFTRIGNLPANQGTALASGQLQFSAILLIAGEVVTSITVLSGSVAAVTPTNQWFGLYDASGNMLRQTSDDTTTAWAALTQKTLSLTSTYTVPTTGLYYVGIMVAAATVPGLLCINGNTTVTFVAPAVCGRDTTHTGLTTPASGPATATISANANQVWAWAS